MNRLFTQAEVDAHLPTCLAYAAGEFGMEDCIPLQQLRLYRRTGVHFYQPYGDTSTSPPILRGLAHCLLISKAELSRLQQKEILETELSPWKPEDGCAVFYVAGVVSDVPGVAAKCIAGVLDLVEASPYKDDICKIAVFCTGPQGYLMSRAFDLEADGFEYREGWPFMERALAPGEIRTLGNNLLSIWTMTKARDVVEMARRQWGADWRSHYLADNDYRRRRA